jgi:mRNA-degrading endonuclease RelE of RelBE toxin-antitoxin system
MNIEISRTFEKDVDPLPKHSKMIILGVINEIQSAKNPHEIKECSKLKGADNLYKIRRGNYRITFEYNRFFAILKRVLPRGQIYKKHNIK